MRLHEIIPHGGTNRRKIRVGRGEGSGRGKTSGRGHKGQWARSGSGLRPGFESGHVPLYRILPRRGFNNYNVLTEYLGINLAALAKVEGDRIDREVLLQAGIIRASDGPVKILGVGDWTRAVTVVADAFSAAAKSKIELAGGTALTPKASES